MRHLTKILFVFSLVVSGAVLATAPARAEPLVVRAEIILGDTGLACEASTEGAIRYTKADKALAFCDGAHWRKILHEGELEDACAALHPHPGSDKQGPPGSPAMIRFPLKLSLLAVLLTGAMLVAVPAFGYNENDPCTMAVSERQTCLRQDGPLLCGRVSERQHRVLRGVNNYRSRRGRTQDEASSPCVTASTSWWTVWPTSINAFPRLRLTASSSRPRPASSASMSRMRCRP